VIPIDLATVTVINDWAPVHFGHHDHAERELAVAIAERNRQHCKTSRGEDSMSAPKSRPERGELASVTRLTYTVDEVAYLLNLSRGITYQYVREGVIPAEGVGRRWVISRRRLHAWLDGLSEG
jgi:excisionase family DNA binding protein